MALRRPVRGGRYDDFGGNRQRRRLERHHDEDAEVAPVVDELHPGQKEVMEPLHRARNPTRKADVTIPSMQPDRYDVIILGGAFSGASTSFLFRRDHPQLGVLIVVKSEEFAAKVGDAQNAMSDMFI